MTLKSIAKKILKAERIAVFGHVSPDLDCLGSAFSLHEGLTKQLNKAVDIFADGKVERYGELIDVDILNAKEFIYSAYDLIIAVDTSTSDRLGMFETGVLNHKNIIKIDHHPELTENDALMKQKYVESTSASASELIYLLLKELNVKITPQIATYLYAGITSDTNSFLNDNVTPRSMAIAGELFKCGADVLKVNRIVFKTISLSKWNLTKVAYEKAEIIGNFGIIGITLKELKKLGNDGEGVSMFANQLISIEGVDLACVYTEKNLRSFRCSFRSKFGTRVDLIAKKLGGGGHKQASGCEVKGSLKEVRAKIVKAIKEGLKEQGV